MDQRELVNKIRNIVDQIITEKGPINMVMLLPDKLNVGSYTILMSSKWLDDMSPFEGTKLIATYFITSMDQGEFKKISRINLVSTLDNSLNYIYSAIHAERSTVHINNCVFFGVKIEEAILLESHKD